MPSRAKKRPELVIDWTSALSTLEEGCAAVFDVTTLTLQPRSPGVTVNHKAANDHLRAAFDFMGTIELEPPSTKIMRHLSADPVSRDDIVSYEAVLTANIAEWPYKPARGDFVVAPDRTWKIEALGQDGSVRPAFYLVRA